MQSEPARPNPREIGERPQRSADGAHVCATLLFAIADSNHRFRIPDSLTPNTEPLTPNTSSLIPSRRPAFGDDGDLHIVGVADDSVDQVAADESFPG